MEREGKVVKPVLTRMSLCICKRTQKYNSNCNHCTVDWGNQFLIVSSLCEIMKHLPFFKLWLSRFLRLFLPTHLQSSKHFVGCLLCTSAASLLLLFVRASFGVNSTLNKFVGHSRTEEVNPYKVVERLEKQTVRKFEICKDIFFVLLTISK